MKKIRIKLENRKILKLFVIFVELNTCIITEQDIIEVRNINRQSELLCLDIGQTAT
jgi:hypothetical protein